MIYPRNCCAYIAAFVFRFLKIDFGCLWLDFAPSNTARKTENKSLAHVDLFVFMSFFGFYSHLGGPLEKIQKQGVEGEQKTI